MALPALAEWDGELYADNSKRRGGGGGGGGRHCQ